MAVSPFSHINQKAQKSSSKIVPNAVVLYEQHGRPLLAIALMEKRGKWLLLNQDGGEIELAPDRIYLLPGSAPSHCKSHKDFLAFLSSLLQTIEREENEIEMEAIWEVASEKTKEYSAKEIHEMVYNKESLESHACIRRLLITDSIYFKRKKNGFEPRPAEIIHELKEKARREEERRNKEDALIDIIIKRFSNPNIELPPEVTLLEQTAALGSQAKGYKEAQRVIDEIVEKGKLNLSGACEEKAFQILVKANHFSPDENLSLIRLDKHIGFHDAVLKEVPALIAENPDLFSAQRKDLTSLYLVTIDDSTTLDIDDAISLEYSGDNLIVGVHITDVSSIIQTTSLLFKEALRRGTSIYSPDCYIPMLPRDISENLSSLKEGAERKALSFFIEFDPQHKIISRKLQPSLVKIAKKLTYDEVDAILCGEIPAATPALEENLLKLWNLTSELELRRMEKGIFQFSRRELRPVIGDNETVRLAEQGDDTPAHKLIGELMILTNETAALFAKDNGFPVIFRSQEAPDQNPVEQGGHIPEGPAREYFQRSFIKRSETSSRPASHYGLGALAYTQVTSPIRRAVDLISQMQINYFLQNSKPLFTTDEIDTFIATLDKPIADAMLLVRERTRYWLLKYIQQEKITDFEATVLKVDGPRPLAELDTLFMITTFNPKHGKNAPAGTPKLKPGDRITLTIERLDLRGDKFYLKEK